MLTKQHSFSSTVKPDIGLLMYPASPKHFTEANAIAREASKRGLTIAYFSYKTINAKETLFPSYVYSDGQWNRAMSHIPSIVDNAPARNQHQEAILKHISAFSFTLCQKLGGKKVTTGILEKNAVINKHLIPSSELTIGNLDSFLRHHNKAIFKPHLGQRGKHIQLVEKNACGNYLLKTNSTQEVLSHEEMCQFITQKTSTGWWLQQYIRSIDADGRAFDIRVPLFRSENGEWQIAKSYARQGAGEVTSNLATGGSVQNTYDFLLKNFPTKKASNIMLDLEKLAYTIADTLQRHYHFTIDALGCDFGLDGEQIYLFEVNSYPGIKGCLNEAAAAKSEYYQSLVSLQKQFPSIVTNNQNIISRHKYSAINKNDSLTFATTPANQRSLIDIINKGENDYSTSEFLIKGLGNPCYLMLKKAAKQQGLSTKNENNTHIEIYHDNNLIGCTSPNSPNTSFASFNVTKNKIRTKKLLIAAGLPTPHGSVYTDVDTARAYFSTCSIPQVVKPLNGGGGKGVTANVRDLETFDYAWPQAAQYGKQVLIEDFAEGDELRLIVLNGDVLAAVCRIPAYVIGNGVNNVRELIEQKNQLRKKNPLLKVYPLTAFDHFRKLQKRTLDEVPNKGEYVRLATTSNVGLGGEALSLTEVLHPSFTTLARKAFNAIPGATQVGFDIMVKDFTADAWEQNAMIIEVNSDPAIGTPRFASFGPPAEAIADHVIRYIHQTFLAEKRRAEQSPALASLQPAQVYQTACGGQSFPRIYATQMLLLRQAAYIRNLDVAVIDSDITLISGGTHQQLFCYGVPQGTLRAARRATNNKRWTKQLLANAHLPSPQGKSFPPQDITLAWKYAQEVGFPIVVKPIAGSGGNGVTTNIDTWERFDSAWRQATANKAPAVLVEEQIIGNDYRIIVIGQHLVAAALREPAHVVGDGVSTIDQLIAAKNQQRKDNPYHGAKTVKLTENILAHLVQSGLTPHSVPEYGQYVQLHTVANIGSGGESIDITDTVHPAWAEVAAQARQAAFNAPFAGLDIMAEDISHPPSTQKWCIIEINLNPDFGVNHFPMRGQGRDVAGCLLQHLFENELQLPPVRKTVRALIQGKVQNVGFRQWLWRLANQKAISGWVKNLPDGHIEAVLEGTSTALESAERALSKGPRKAIVSSVSVTPYKEVLSARNFSIL